MHRFLLFIVAFCGFFINVQAKTEREVIYDAIPEARYFDERYGIYLPWDGYNTTSPVYNKLPAQILKIGDLQISHPADYSLFINDRLFYRSKNPDTVIFHGSEISGLTGNDTLTLTHNAVLLNSSLLRVCISREKSDFAAVVLGKEIASQSEQMHLFLYLLLFLAFVLVKTISAREFEFYFSGMYIRSPRLSLEKFMGDSLNPFLIFLSVLALSLILIEHIEALQLLEYQKLNFDLINTNSKLFSFLLVAASVIAYLFIKRTMYVIFMWLRQEQREFSAVWRSYLLSFTNLTFWFFLFYSIPLLLFPNFDFGKFFQIIFFIFAALNAVGGIMVYSNFRMRANLISISGILAIDIFPIILLVQLLTF